MNLKDLYAKKTPLKIGKDVVEGVFIKEAPLSELTKLQSIIKEKNLDKQLELATNLLKVCIIDENNKYPFDENNKLSNNYIMEVVNQVIEVNIPKEGK